MVALVVALVGSYLLGSIPFGYLVGQFAGIDIRSAGSRNVGATNVVRLLGKRYGYPVFVLDFLKGFGAVKISMLIATSPPPGWNSAQTFGVIAALGSVLGHSYSPWLKFKGGKGVATAAGALLALMPIAVLMGAAVWILVFLATRYVSLASVITAALLPIVILVISWGNEKTWIVFYLSVCLAAVVIWRHRSNLSRLMRGTEPRFTRK